MDLTALQNRYWWLIDDSPSNPLLMDATTLTALINDARRDMADRLQNVKNTATLEVASDGAVSMPSDFISIEKIKCNDCDLKFYEGISVASSYNYEYDDNDDDSYTNTSGINRYIFLNNSQIQVLDYEAMLTTNQRSVGTNTTGFTAVNSATLSRSTAQYYSGTASLSVVTPGSVTDEGFSVAATGLTLAVDETYVSSLYVKGTGTITLKLEESGSTTASTSDDETTLSSAWQRIDVYHTITDAANTTLTMYVTTSSTAQSTTFYADALQLEAGTSPTDWPLIELWYQAYPVDLSAGTDVPSEIPPEYHASLVDKYVRAQHCLKNGWHSLYQALMLEWEDVKNEVSGKTYARTRTVENAGRFEW